MANKPTQEEIDLAEKKMQTINERLIKDELIDSDHIYLDLALIKDLEIGAVMAMASEKSEECARETYGIILEGMPKYKKRAYADIKGYIPKIPFTREEIDDYLDNPLKSDRIFACAPATSFIKELGKQILINANHSQVLEKSDVPIRIHVNTHPLTLSEEFGKSLMAFVAGTFHVECTYFSQDPIAIPYEQYQTYDEFYFYYFSQFSLHPKIHESLGSFDMVEKYVFALRSLGPRKTRLPPDPRKREKYLNESFMRIESGFIPIFKKFKLINPELCSP